VKGRESPMREVSKASSSPIINSAAAPELDSILTDLDSQDWRTRYPNIEPLGNPKRQRGKKRYDCSMRGVSKASTSPVN
jgi:hypothetical protein